MSQQANKLCERASHECPASQKSRTTVFGVKRKDRAVSPTLAKTFCTLWLGAEGEAAEVPKGARQELVVGGPGTTTEEGCGLYNSLWHILRSCRLCGWHWARARNNQDQR